MGTLTAIFSNDTADRLLRHYNAECRQRGHDCNLCAPTSIAPKSSVTGPAQEVMFFIGYVAANGEDTLIEVRSRPDLAP